MSRRRRQFPGAVAVVAELISDQVDGLWCDYCLLPSGSGAWLAIYVDGELHTIRLVQVCQDCHTEGTL